MLSSIFTPNELIAPLFVSPEKDAKLPIDSLPGLCQMGLSKIVAEVSDLLNLGISTVVLYALQNVRDEIGSSSWKRDGLIQETAKRLREKFPALSIVTDVCVCQYTNDGHCILHSEGLPDSTTTATVLGRQALSHAEAGANWVMISSMADGVVTAIRELLDANGYKDVQIMSQSAKFNSALYGGFRAASAPEHREVDKSAYQLHPSERTRALARMASDVESGVSMLVVKPALGYLDILAEARARFDLPIVAFMTSGEYFILKESRSREMLQVSLESIRRAGADKVLTYFAKEIASDIRG